MNKTISPGSLLLFLCLFNTYGASAKSPEDFLSGPSEQGKVDLKKTETKKADPVGTKVVPVLDTSKIHALYLEGDFDKAIKPIENFLKSKQLMSRADSTFAFKHLGVMYAAAPATREKGKYYMYQLINIEPTTKILDMYASDMIYLIYRNVQEDYELKQGKRTKKNGSASQSVVAAPNATSSVNPPSVAQANAAGTGTSASTSSKPKSKSESKRTTYLITGGAVVAVGVIGLTYILFNSPKSTTRTLVVSE